MRISQSNWTSIEEFLKTDDRCILPIGCTEQHAHLSLATDSILAEKVSLDAAEPLKTPVFPVIPYGATPQFMAYPGTITLRVDTLCRVVEDILDSLVHHGFKRILIVNGHGGNSPLANFMQEWKLAQWKAGRGDVRVKFHNWWNAPKTWAKVQEIDPVASHASWMENFPWTRLQNVIQPNEQKVMIDFDTLKLSNPAEVRELLKEGNFGGYFIRSDDEMLALWQVAVEETRELLEKNW